MSISVSSVTRARSAARCRKASMPTKASTRRFPDPTDCSPSRDRLPIREVFDDVGAAAELAGPRAVDLHDPDFAAVVLAEQRHGAEGLGLGEAHDLGVHPEVVADGEVGDFLDLGPGGGAQALTPGEVEAQVAGLVEGAALSGLRAEDLVQGRVHDVRAGVGLLGGVPAFAVHGGPDQRVGSRFRLRGRSPCARSGP